MNKAGGKKHGEARGGRQTSYALGRGLRGTEAVAYPRASEGSNHEPSAPALTFLRLRAVNSRHVSYHARVSESATVSGSIRFAGNRRFPYFIPSRPSLASDVVGDDASRIVSGADGQPPTPSRLPRTGSPALSTLPLSSPWRRGYNL